MAGSLILVRHARPRVAADKVPGSWSLTEEGIDDAQRLGLSLRDLVGDGPVAVVCSAEQKAIETGENLGLGLVNIDERLSEVSRPWHEDERSFRAAVESFLSGTPAPGWEPIDHALARFRSAISDHSGTSVVVSHGTIMAAWLGSEIPGVEPFSFWAGLQMPDAWLVDLSAQSATRIVVGLAPEMPR